MSDQFRARRVNVVGTSSVGKTTVAAALASRLGVPHVELDALHWEPNWTAAPTMFSGSGCETRSPATAGWWTATTRRCATLLWDRAEAVVWLDPPLRTILWRYLTRTIRRVARREELWGGNREHLSTHLFGRDSLLWWILTTYRRRRREFPPLLAARPDLVAIHLRSARAADRWLADVSRGVA